VMGAALSSFKDEFKAATGKKAKELTVDLLKGTGTPKTDGDSEESGESVWEQVVGDVPFVMQDLAQLSENMRARPLQRLCDKATALMGLYAGNCAHFAGDVALKVTLLMADRDMSGMEEQGQEQEQDKEPTAQELVNALVLLVDDRKDFLVKLKQKMEAAGTSTGSEESKQAEQEEVDSASDSSAKQPEAYESVVAKMVLLVSKLEEQYWHALEKTANEADKTMIKVAKEKVDLGNLDPESLKLTKDFMDYFFQPQGMELCDCGGDSFFGRIFGGLCK